MGSHARSWRLCAGSNSCDGEDESKVTKSLTPRKVFSILINSTILPVCMLAVFFIEAVKLNIERSEYTWLKR